MILLRYLLLILTLPLSLLYAGILRLRHFAYDKGYLVARSFPLPVLAIGNLHFGGTGKTPLVDWLVERLPVEKLAVCARGYGRRSKADLIDCNSKTNEAEIGEELYFLKQKHKQLQVLAAKKRVQAIDYLQKHYPERRIVILDDALQHRQIRPSLTILLCPFAKPYTQDLLVPSGFLRDIKASAKRADIVIVSKSPADLSKEKAEKYRQILRLEQHQKLFFTNIEYGKPVQVAGEKRNFSQSPLILLQGVARPEYLENYLRSQNLVILRSLRFPDHHRYRVKDLQIIEKLWRANPQAVVLSTEKDWPKLQNFSLPFPLYLLPIKTRFLWGEEDFLSLIRTHINAYA